MIRFRRAFGVGAVVIAPAATSVATATAQSSKDAPKAEIGVTANEIHIAVVADVDNRWRRACSRARLQG